MTIHRVITLAENGNGNPSLSQFPSGVIKSFSILKPLYVGYGGTKPSSCWPPKGYWHKFMLYRHSANLYLASCGRGPNNSYLNWLEASPRNGLRSRDYCEQVTHGWRIFRCTGWDNTDPENPVWVRERMQKFAQQPPAPSTITPETPWTVGDYELHEIIPSVPCTVAGYDMPAYTSQISDPDGDEMD